MPCVADEHGVDDFSPYRNFGISEDEVRNLCEPILSNRIWCIELNVLLDLTESCNLGDMLHRPIVAKILNFRAPISMGIRNLEGSELDKCSIRRTM